MKIIALVPVRNEAWVLEHSLTCWSGFCDVVIVNDQKSTDETREIAAVSRRSCCSNRRRRIPSPAFLSRHGGGCSMPRETTTATICSGAPTPTN